MLEHGDSAPRSPNSALTLGRLKTALQNDGAFGEWAMSPVLEHLNSKLETQNSKLLQALVAALNDRANLSALDAFPVWRDASPQELK
jgi:hypothetical protein